MLRGLQQAGDVELLCVSEGPPDASAAQHLQDLFSKVTIMPFSPVRFRVNAARALVTPGEPIQVGYYRFAGVSEWVENALRQCDLAFAFHVRMADYVTSAPVPKMVDMVDAISLNYRRALHHPLPLSWRTIYRVEIPRLEAYEVRTTRLFDRSYVVADADRDHLVACGADAVRLHVLGNGTVAVSSEAFPASPEDIDLLFVGHMGTQSNQAAVTYFVSEVLPILRAHGLRPKLSIVGLQPGSAVRALANDPEITVTGEVDDPLTYVRRSKVVLAPMVFGAGVQNKILEGMAMGKPVVTTTIGAEGLVATSGVHLVIADGAAAIADAVERLLNDPDLRSRLGAAASHRVRERYSWASIYDRIAEDVDWCLRGTGSRKVLG